MIVFIHHSVNPYRVAFFNKLAGSTEIPFKVYFLSRPAKNREWRIEDFDPDFEYEFLPGWKFYVPGNDHSYFQLNVGIWKRLKKDNPDMVITIGWNYLAAFAGFFYTKINNKKFVIWSESTKFEKSFQRTLTLPIVKSIVRRAEHLIAAGTRAKEYLIELGAEPGDIETAYYTIDTKSLIKQAKGLKKRNFDIRKKYNWDSDTKIVLYVGQLITRKGITNLLKLARELRKDKKLKFLLVGYGPLEKSIEKFIDENGLDNIVVTGFVDNTEVMKYYVSCDVFILLSHEETWGLVVNEAMCASKPVIVSKYAGCSEDLVANGKNGYTVDPKDLKNVERKLKSLTNDASKAKRFGQLSLRKIKKVNLAQNVRTIRSIISNG